MIFRDIWKSSFNIDCFTRNITLAQSVMEVFKTNYLKEKEIAIIPRDGYDRKHKQSYIANAWLDYIQQFYTKPILREYALNSCRVDGFIPDTKEIFEFYGCFYHGCPKCYLSNREKTFNHVNGLAMDILHRQTIDREKSFIEKDFL